MIVINCKLAMILQRLNNLNSTSLSIGQKLLIPNS